VFFRDHGEDNSGESGQGLPRGNGPKNQLRRKHDGISCHDYCGQRLSVPA